MYFGLHVKYPLFLSDFNETWIFSTDFRKNLHIPNFMKIRPVGAEMFHADGRTDRQDEANGRFVAILRTRLKRTFSLVLTHTSHLRRKAVVFVCSEV
jgi:hypothetical protein